MGVHFVCKLYDERNPILTSFVEGGKILTKSLRLQREVSIWLSLTTLVCCFRQRRKFLRDKLKKSQKLPSHTNSIVLYKIVLFILDQFLHVRSQIRGLLSLLLTLLGQSNVVTTCNVEFTSFETGLIILIYLVGEQFNIEH